MAILEFELDGEPKLLKELEALEDRYPKATAAAVFQDALEHIFGPSQEECPVEFSVLRGSAVADPPTEGESVMQTVISYNTDYAVPVHDNPKARHPVGKYRYLLDPFLKAQSGMTSRVAKRARYNAERHVGISRLRKIEGEGE